MIRLGEAKPVEERDRAGAHGHDVPQDPAYAGRGSLERLHGGRVVVALDLERDRLTIAEVENAGVLTRALQNALSFARQPPEEECRVLVAAVLGPEKREDGELEIVRVAVEQRTDAFELPVREAECAVERLFRDAAQRTTQGVSLSSGPDLIMVSLESGG